MASSIWASIVVAITIDRCWLRRGTVSGHGRLAGGFALLPHRFATRHGPSGGPRESSSGGPDFLFDRVLAATLRRVRIILEPVEDRFFLVLDRHWIYLVARIFDHAPAGDEDVLLEVHPFVLPFGEDPLYMFSHRIKLGGGLLFGVRQEQREPLGTGEVFTPLVG